ncbi:MAG: hypothetical protein CUN55_00025 [Phototrophicales bacterium]|nr:MAG: hypothetical protein CUN55_00025 [Phototrophicales bacterium]
MDANPYNPLKPVIDPTMFYGREDALRFLMLHLSGRRTRRALVVLGTRGIGKSSLLGRVPLVVDERYPSVKVDAAAIELDNIIAFVATIVDQTRAMMTAIEASTYRLPPFPDVSDPNTDLLAWLADDYLSVVFSAIRRTRHLILMVDNLHLVFDAIDAGHFPTGFMGYWQHLLERYEQLDLLFSLDMSYEERALQTPPMDDPNLYYRLSHLKPEEALQLITEPVKTLYGFEPQALEQIQSWAGGHPYHLQAIGRLLYRRWEEDRAHVNLITSHDLQAIYPAVLEMAKDTISPIWEILRPNERLVLTAFLDMRAPLTLDDLRNWLESAGYPLEKVQIAAALRGLEYMNVIQVDQDGRFDFCAQIEADWLYQQNLGELSPPLRTFSQRWRNAFLGIALVIVIVVGGTIVFLGERENNNSIENVATTTLEPQNPTATVRPMFEFGG